LYAACAANTSIIMNRFFLFFISAVLYGTVCMAQEKTNAEPEWKKVPLDSTVFSGKVNSKGILYVAGTKGCLQMVFVNGEPVAQMYNDTIKVDFKEFGLKAGQPAKVKAIYLNSGKVSLLPHGGLDVKRVSH
jgi:hypothetical protein